ncbi:Hsp33 family molecular chaperone HslO [Leptospira wolffii]|uniref:Molecular chaperone Hsp33 n=1 Tax=Leptospira wolffii TaxID=409998 RepID=A0A2M9ZER5_9LEPT|nr:Hsp33 family molecular chaperone HslO [Leptospira wolffii]EPG65061.1 chaperonin HslO [Leptospira wolffii serovar Khorat str. Khorat-H2]PJZ66919.1 molecular chaperone Hsp33 [Leptospira wolffii]TGK61890.1 Hsp33 family molecular chaperone HslO [Leptospira wolffii]TGK68491.1 Hsp33 family molecular chaperone HslO [Leptospira wolffii]TGK74726.1 Hsp33 family molecular chaperone HslO [Leptospira wolffii]
MENQDTYAYGILPDVHFRFSAAEISYAVTAASNLHGFDDTGTELLARTMLSAFFLADLVKGETKVSVQIRFYDDSEIHSVLAYSTRQGRMKATLRHRPEEDVESGQISEENLGILKVFRWKDGECIYQSIVPFRNQSFEANIEAYLRDSEQVPSFLVAFVKLEGLHWKVKGLFLQALPEARSEHIDAVREWAGKVEERKAVVFAGKIRESLQSLEADWNTKLQILEEGTPQYRCDCSEEKIKELIQNLGKEEAMDIAEEQGQIEVTCEFCNSIYRFPKEQVLELF